MRIKAALVTTFLSLGFLGSSCLMAQASNVSRVAVINMQQAILESIEGKKAAETLKTKYDAKAAELEKKKKEIEALSEELKKQEKNLSEDAQTQKAKLIDTKNKELTRTGEDANNEFQQLQNEAINKIGTKIMRILQVYASEQNFSLVVDSSSPQGGVLYHNPATDITTEVIRRFDAQATGATTPKAPAPAPATKK